MVQSQSAQEEYMALFIEIASWFGVRYVKPLEPKESDLDKRNTGNYDKHGVFQQVFYEFEVDCDGELHHKGEKQTSVAKIKFIPALFIKNKYSIAKFVCDGYRIDIDHENRKANVVICFAKDLMEDNIFRLKNYIEQKEFVQKTIAFLEANMAFPQSESDEQHARFSMVKKRNAHFPADMTFEQYDNWTKTGVLQ